MSPGEGNHWTTVLMLYRMARSWDTGGCWVLLWLVCLSLWAALPVACGWFLPSVLILRAVRTRANRVALNMTVPSLFRGIFMETRRWRGRRGKADDYSQWFSKDSLNHHGRRMLGRSLDNLCVCVCLLGAGAGGDKHGRWKVFKTCSGKNLGSATSTLTHCRERERGEWNLSLLNPCFQPPSLLRRCSGKWACSLPATK